MPYAALSSSLSPHKDTLRIAPADDSYENDSIIHEDLSNGFHNGSSMPTIDVTASGRRIKRRVPAPHMDLDDGSDAIDNKGDHSYSTSGLRKRSSKRRSTRAGTSAPTGAMNGGDAHILASQASIDRHMDDQSSPAVYDIDEHMAELKHIWHDALTNYSLAWRLRQRRLAEVIDQTVMVCFHDGCFTSTSLISGSYTEVR